MKHQLKKFVTPGLLTVSLICISVGCWWERPSLGLIVPSAIILCVYIGWYFLPLLRRRDT